MSIDFNLPQFEFRFLLLFLFKDRFSSITNWFSLRIKIPWFSSWYLIYKDVTIIEISTMKRKSCWKFLFWNKIYRNFYDCYPKVEEYEKAEIGNT